jgi:ABC-type transporter Mla subunit MlaD
MPINLDATNTWLAVMAIAIVVQTLLMIAGAVAAYQVVRQVNEAITRLEDHLSPLGARVTQVADDVQEVITRVRRADDAARALVARLDAAAHVAGHAIGARMWPIVGLTRAVAAAARSLTSRSSTPASSIPPRTVAETRVAGS